MKGLGKKMETKTDYSNILTTSDIKTSAYLLACGIELFDTTKEQNKLNFCFVNSDKVKGFLKDYWGGRASVSPRLLFEKLDYLKDLIHRDYKF